VFTASAACRFVPALALLVACGGGDLLLPAEGEPAALRVVRGDGQSGRVGAALADSVVALVSDGQGRPVAGVPVALVLEDGTDAFAAPDTVATGADGTAAFQVTLGTRVGTVRAHVTAPAAGGAGTLSAPISLSAVSADANGLAAISGDGQEAPVGSALPDPLVVRVTDGFGNPIPGVAVSWTVAGGGSVSAAATTTGDDGLTSVRRTLGPGAGTQHTLAAAPGLAGSPVDFVHTAMAGSATVLEPVSGDGQSAQAGTALADPLVVRVHDAEGNPVPGLAVAWIVGQGGGTLAPSTSLTGADGIASTRWTLGAPGANRATAVVSGVGAVGFTATGNPIDLPRAIRTTIRITADDPDPSEVGQPVTVRFTVTAESGIPTGTVILSAKDGAEGCSAQVADGACTLTLTSPGDRTLTAAYSGDAAFAGSEDTERHTVKAPPPPPPPPAVPSATRSSIKIKDATLRLNHDTEVKVIVRDAGGTPLEGVSVTLLATGDGNTIRPGSATSNGRGETKFAFRSSVAGDKTLTAIAGGVTLADHQTITVEH
jgi:hypothetical protein